MVISHAGFNNRRHAIWNCRCDCGVLRVVIGCDLRSGHTASCGCFRKERELAQFTTHGLSRSAPGKINQTRLYTIWEGMKKRCVSNYKNYGARGIRVCNEWLSFPPFYKWAMANGYRDDLTLDRKKNDLGYSSDNCQWATMKVQQNNKSNNRLITFKNETMTVTAWAESVGIRPRALFHRLDVGWPIEKAITTPVRIRTKRG